MQRDPEQTPLEILWPLWEWHCRESTMCWRCFPDYRSVVSAKMTCQWCLSWQKQCCSHQKIGSVHVKISPHSKLLANFQTVPFVTFKIRESRVNARDLVSQRKTSKMLDTFKRRIRSQISKRKLKNNFYQKSDKIFCTVFNDPSRYSLAP